MCGLASGILKFLKENEPQVLPPIGGPPPMGGGPPGGEAAAQGTGRPRRSAWCPGRSAWWHQWPPGRLGTRCLSEKELIKPRAFLSFFFHSIHHLLCFLTSIFEFYRLQVRPQRFPMFTFDARDDRRRSG